MKRTAMLLLVVLICSVERVSAQSDKTIQQALDSLKVIQRTGGYVDGHGPQPTADEIRFNKIIGRQLLSLPYSEAKRLLHDTNAIARTYGCLIIGKSYTDSFTTSDQNIFEDTSSLPIYTPAGIIRQAGITVGQYCKEGYLSELEERKLKDRRSQVIEAVRSFIKSNAEYPDTYLPDSFTAYTWSQTRNDATDERVTHYTLKHHYHIKRHDGKIIADTQYFKLDNDLKVVVVERQLSNVMDVFPPQIEMWMQQYGRKKKK